MRSMRINRSGMTSVLAMLYLVLFSTLAIGFYAATNTQSQVVGNDERVARASLACESGMELLRYQLGLVWIPPEPLPPDQIINELYADLQSQLKDTGNMDGLDIALVGNTIQIPADGGTVRLDDTGHMRFRATITDWAGEIVVKIDGINGTTSTARAITMDYTRANHPTTVFDHAVASKGQIWMKKGAVTAVTGVDPRIATMMSALPGDAANPSFKVTGGLVGGDISIIEEGYVQVTGGSVGGSSIPATILSDHVSVVEPPEFPTITTDVFIPYATNPYVPNEKTQQNIRIPANTNPKFNGGDTVQGIMYIESPNEVTFNGNFNLQGFIVFENSGDSGSNVLDFKGNVSQSPLPASSEFDALRSTSGVSILAPTAYVHMSGSTDSYLRGSVIVGRLGYDGSADIQIDQGTLMTYDETANSAVFDGKSIKFTATGQNTTPTIGMTYSTYYEPKPVTYQEVTP